MGIEKRKAELERDIARKTRHLEALKAMPDFEALEDGIVLTLVVTLGRSKPYTYIAFRTSGVWYLTGKLSPNGVSSADLAEWLVSQGRMLVSASVLGQIENDPAVVLVDLGSLLDEMLGGLLERGKADRRGSERRMSEYDLLERGYGD